MKGIAKRWFWLVPVPLLAAGAFLIAASINAIIEHEIRTEAMDFVVSRPARGRPGTRSLPPSNRIIVERNYFGSAKAAPVERKPSPAEQAFLLSIQPHLNRETIAAFFEAGKDYIHKLGESDRLNLHCKLFEGRWCYFIAEERIALTDGRHDPEIENRAHRLPADLAVEITNQVGTKHIEHARYNGVKVRCTRPRKSRKPPGCEVDWGWGKGWEPLAVR